MKMSLGTVRGTEERNGDLLEGPKGRYGWGHHPYTLLTAIFTFGKDRDNKA